MIYVVNKKRKEENIKKEYPGAIILDITSKSAYAQKLSPFYPHGGIPIPFSEGMTAMCVEGIWQGLKVFEHEDVNLESFTNATMKNLKRTVRRLGYPRGHRKGVYGTELLDYLSARILIYLPTYRWVLDNVPEVRSIVERIKVKSQETDIVLLDYNTNLDFRNLSTPLSHAGLVKLYIEGKYPEPDLEEELRLATEASDTASSNPAKKPKKKRTAKRTINETGNQPTLFD
ncbi:hypothetical protein [Bacteroides acidifaciens]|uniref:DUF6939 family protein n=1 Tax=Bacteroides acidifaciens TaxID=85831 RepID=UPI002578E205|nr:hypothetical protein [Bacteroides acidifaciens]